jgi:itaconate CoA-transferase
LAERSRNRKELKMTVENFSRGADAETWLASLQAAAIASAKVNDMKGSWDHPQLKVRDRWCEVEASVERISMLKPAGTADGVEARVDPIPSVDQHGEDILKELGILR